MGTSTPRVHPLPLGHGSFSGSKKRVAKSLADWVRLKAVCLLIVARCRRSVARACPLEETFACTRCRAFELAVCSQKPFQVADGRGKAASERREQARAQVQRERCRTEIGGVRAEGTNREREREREREGSEERGERQREERERERRERRGEERAGESREREREREQRREQKRAEKSRRERERERAASQTKDIGTMILGEIATTATNVVTTCTSSTDQFAARR
jgi:hypothetical protein